MKKTFILTLFLGSCLASYGQLVNSTNIYIGKDAVVSSNAEVINSGNLQGEGTIHVRNGLSNQGQNQLGTVILDGQAVQHIGGNTPLSANIVIMNQTDKVVLQNTLKVNQQLALGKGIIESQSDSPLQVESNAIVTGASNRSHIKGYIQKLGSDAFDFPVGDGTELHTFKMAQLTNDDFVKVGFISQNPNRVSNKLATEIAEVTGNSYWAVQAQNTSPVEVGVSADVSQAQLLQFRGNQWELSPSTLQNNVVSAEAVLRGVSYFTIGTQISELNDMPDMTVSPNPSNGSFQVRLKGFSPEDNVMIDIADMNGRVIMKQEGKVKSLNTKYSLGQEVASGNYVLKVVRPDKSQTFTQKLLIQR